MDATGNYIQCWHTKRSRFPDSRRRQSQTPATRYRTSRTTQRTHGTKNTANTQSILDRPNASSGKELPGFIIAWPVDFTGQSRQAFDGNPGVLELLHLLSQCFFVLGHVAREPDVLQLRQGQQTREIEIVINEPEHDFFELGKGGDERRSAASDAAALYSKQQTRPRQEPSKNQRWDAELKLSFNHSSLR